MLPVMDKRIGKAWRVPVAPTEDERATLRTMARSHVWRVRTRARIVLGLADGESTSALAARLSVVPATVAAWASRFAAGRLAGLADRPGRGRRKNAPETDAAVASAATHCAKRRSRPGRGGTAAARAAAFVRDSAALGRFSPGAVLPSRAWFAERFGCNPSSLAGAFSRLEKEGFVRSAPRRGTRLADRLPFSGRHLLVLASGEEWLDLALREAARRTGAARGVSWTVREAFGFGGEEARRAFFDRIRGELLGQRWAGAFFRVLDGGDDCFIGNPPPSTVDSVPMAGVILPGRWKTGSLVRQINPGEVSPNRKPWDRVLREIAERGFRELGVLAHGPLSREDEDSIRAAAARAGLHIAPCAVQAARIREKGTLWRAAETVVHATGLARHGNAAVGKAPRTAFFCEIDGFARVLVDSLVAHLGMDATGCHAIFALGNKPSLPDLPMRVHWHGIDLEKTLQSFLDWCDAIHAGEPSPPPPCYAWF